MVMQPIEVPRSHVPGRVSPSLISVTHKTILESLSQMGALAVSGFGGFGGEYGFPT